MFDPSQFDYTDLEIEQAAAENRLLSLEIEFNRQCNYRCPYCYAVTTENMCTDYDPQVIDTAVQQAAELGARKIVILGGEPLLLRNLKEKVEKITALGMGAEIFTNGSIMTPELASFLYAKGCRVVVKLNTRNPEVHDRLTGAKNSLENSLRTLKLLKEAGFTSGMLCASTVISTENIDDVVDLWKYLRENDIKPYFEIMTPQGRLLENQELVVDTLRLKNIFEELQQYDREAGHIWEAQPPLVGAKCLRHTYSALVNAQGDVFPCVGIDIKIGNIMETHLRQILRYSDIINDLKNHREMIKGPCRVCDKAATCYGCRGAAYQLTGDYLASDPLCWHNADKIDQIQALPTSAKPFMPHRPPIAMVEMIRQAGPVNILSAVIHPDNRFLNSEGVLDRSVIPELVAQAGAAMDSFHYDGRVQPGFLAIGHAIRFSQDIHAGDEIFISYSSENVFGGWHLLNFKIKNQHDVLCAQGEVNVCVI